MTARTSPRRIALLILILVAAAVAASFDSVHQQLVAGLQFTGDLMNDYPVRGALLFVAVSALSAMLMFFSSVVLVPVGIEAWGELGCFLLLWGGWFLGGLITYSVGRYLGRPMIEKMLSQAAIESYERRVPPGGSFMTALLIQLAFPSDIVGYFFGLLRYRRSTYLGALLCAELPYAFGTVFLGAAFMQQQYLLLLGGAVLAVLVLAWQWWMRGRKPPA